MRDDRSLFTALIGDGRPLLIVSSLSLMLAGLFALFLSATGHFLPHDVQFLQMEPKALCAINECRIVHFMIHDRVSFGGALIAIASLYIWLAEFPLRDNKAWAWVLFFLSGVIGFGSFLAYLGYGYLDSWHGVATLALLPFFGFGLILTKRRFQGGIDWKSMLIPAEPLTLKTRYGIGRIILLATAMGLLAAGATIMTLGMTSVFVPEDLAFMGLPVERLRSINPRLVPLIAHDRAGFGGAICTCGMLMFFCVWCSPASRNLWQALAVAGSAGFMAAILVHPIIGYTNFFHLAPAVAGGVIFYAGMILTYSKCMCPRSEAHGESGTIAGVNGALKI